MNAPLKHPLTANTAGEVSEDPPGAPTAAEPAMTGETPPAEVAATAAADAVTPETTLAEADDFGDGGEPIRVDENIPSFEIPGFIVTLLKDAHRYILPGESSEDFRNLYYSLETEFVVKNLQEYSLILDYAMLVWETLRYRRMKVGIERNNRHAAVETLFRRLCNGKVPKDAGNDFFSDPVFQAQTRKDFEVKFDTVHGSGHSTGGANVLLELIEGNQLVSVRGRPLRSPIEGGLAGEVGR
jgi:hypothetical protein